MTLPAELVQQYVDAGRSPDAFAAALHARATRSSDAVRAKQTGFRRLEEGVRAQCGDFLADAVSKS